MAADATPTQTTPTPTSTASDAQTPGAPGRRKRLAIVVTAASITLLGDWVYERMSERDG